MKKLLIVILAIGSFSSLAHPGDNELMSDIDLGSKLKIQKEIIIPNNNKVIFMNGTQYQYFTQVVGDEPGCKLTATDLNDNDFERDVVVRAGVTLKVFIRGSTKTGGLLGFLTEKDNLFYIFCWKGMNHNGTGKGIPTVGQVKKALSGVASIELSDPIEL